MNSFASLLNTQERLQKQDKERSKQISHEDCKKRMRAPESFSSDLLRMTIIVTVIFILYSITR